MNTKRLITLFAAGALTLSIHAADAKESLEAAVKALKEKGSYSWSSTSEMANSQFPAMVTKGKTDKEGNSLLTAEGQNGEVQAARKGDKGVLKTEEGWKTTEEMAQGGQGGGRGRGFFGGRMLLNAPLPADDVAELLKGVKEIKAGDGGTFTAELTEQAAKDRAGFFGRRGGRGAAPGGFTPPEPKDAKGSVKFWVKDGVLAKYELKTSSKMSFQGEERDLDRTITVEISAVGSTKVEVPEEAKKKL